MGVLVRINLLCIEGEGVVEENEETIEQPTYRLYKRDIAIFVLMFFILLRCVRFCSFIVLIFVCVGACVLIVLSSF